MIKLGWYRHFKGGQYRVIGTGKHTTTGEELVIYHHHNEPQKLWTRPASEFQEDVSDRTDNVACQKRRFEYIEA